MKSYRAVSLLMYSHNGIYVQSCCKTAEAKARSPICKPPNRELLACSLLNLFCRRDWRLALLIALLMSVMLQGMACGAMAENTDSSLVITHVTVIDPRGGPPQQDMTIIVRRDRIEKIEKSSVAHAYEGRVLDGRGKFLIPGLWDMEVHLSWTRASALPLLVANGITGVRDMGGRLQELEIWRSQISAGLRVGPSIFQVGPMLNGKSFNPLQMAVGTPEETRGVVRTLKFVGVNGLSIERRMPRDSYFALMEEAKRQGLPVGGHIPMTVRPEEASDAGQTTIDNAETIFDGTFGEGIKDADLPGAIEGFLSSGAAATLFARFVKNHNAVTPAIVAYQWSVESLDRSNSPDHRLIYVAASVKKEFQKEHLSPEDAELMQRLYPVLIKVVGQLHRSRVMLLAGTDVAATRVPGFSLHDELSLLVKAGLTPLEAIQAATLNPAIMLQKSADFGVVEPGKIADLVLLDANPLDNIENTKRISAVVLKGKLFTRNDLDSLLRQSERLASQN